jgi:hypothetical protein
MPSLLKLDIWHLKKQKQKVEHQTKCTRNKTYTIKVAIDIFGFGVTFLKNKFKKARLITESMWR